MCDEAGLDPVLCGEALDILEAALFVTAPTAMPTCKNCGKALQAEWTVCPFCGVTRTAPQTKTPSKPAAPASSLPSSSLKPESPPITGFVYIQGGTFTMGSPASEPNRLDREGPQHRVTVSGFYMAQYAVTQAEYEAVTGSNPSCFKGANLPVERVSQYDAIKYCNERSKHEGLTPAYTIAGRNVTLNKNTNGYRLPTEAEWEYACRAGTTTPFSNGDNITTDQANYNGNYPYNNNAKGEYRRKTMPVGSFAPNRWGLYDMHGNVWEWCWDRYADYAGGSQTDPSGAASGSDRVFRGGGWGGHAVTLRSAHRCSGVPTGRDGNLGFRVVRP
ncbi:hypothetical protein FACS1894200_09380 [Spirochaetia bacterium]|nr:hypothetical protein FACS1894200_09380 [Spirochaetia bacterium]